MDTAEALKEATRAATAWSGCTVLETCLVGSSYILGSGEDIDCLLLVSNLQSATESAQLCGYEKEGGESYDTSTFYSLRKGDLNILLTEDLSFYSGFKASADVCRFLKVANKPDRIAVHRRLMDGEQFPFEEQDGF